MRELTMGEIEEGGAQTIAEAVKEGPVAVVDGGVTRYIALDKARYEELREAEHERFVAETLASVEEARAGRGRRMSAEEIIKEFGLDS